MFDQMFLSKRLYLGAVYIYGGLNTCQLLTTISQRQNYSNYRRNNESDAQATPSDKLPGYNHQLTGKGKSKRSTSKRWGSWINGEILFGFHPVHLALVAKRRKTFHKLYVNETFGKSSKVSPILNQICRLASEANIPLVATQKQELDFLSGDRPHQGVCLDCQPITCSSWNEEASFIPDGNHGNIPIWLFLHNIQDPMNFGAIVRSSYFMGVEKIVVPQMNSCKLSPVVSKASSGALEVVDVMKLACENSTVEFLQWWKMNGGHVLGTCGGPNLGKAVPLQDFKLTKASLLVLGNEGTGISEEISRLCDTQLYIDTYQGAYMEGLDSLNVSVATGILLHWLKTFK